MGFVMLQDMSPKGRWETKELDNRSRREEAKKEQ